jgi:hypothetical protein
VNRLFESIFSFFLNASSFLEGLRLRRDDDPLLSEFKKLMLAAIGSLALILGVLLAGWVARTTLDVVETFPGAKGAVDSAVELWGTAFDIALGVSFLIASLVEWFLVRFFQKLDQE